MVTFTRTTPGIFNAADGTFGASTTTTITGDAIQVRGNPDRYDALNLVLGSMPTLFFTPTLYDLRAGSSDFVLPGDSVQWNLLTYIVKDIDPIAPDGIIIAARIIISR